MNTITCPCGSGSSYSECCEPLHLNRTLPSNAEQLMRSRYCAYTLQLIDYIIVTTVPAQQALLDHASIAEWSQTAQWLGLTVLQHLPKIDKTHAIVEFEARFANPGEAVQTHRECSAFVQIGERWYFIDPTVPLPAMKQPCICGSGKKFKQCCGQFFR